MKIEAKIMKKIFLSLLLIPTLFMTQCSNQQSEKIIVSTPNAPAAIGPYSQAIIYNNMVYCSGQIAIDPQTNQLVDGDITVQTNQVFKNIKAILEAANTSLSNVVRCTVYLADMNDFATMNSVYESYFPEGNYPARSAIEVASLPKNALIEIEATATLH